MLKQSRESLILQSGQESREMKQIFAYIAEQR